MKKILTLFTICMSLVGCNSTPQESPEQSSIGAVYSMDSKVINGSKTASEVVSKLQAIRLNGCPSEFVDAYRTYIKSWDKLAGLEKRMYAVNMSKATSDIEKFISNYQSNSIDATVALKKEWPSFASDIDSITAEMARCYTNFTAAGTKYNAVYKKSSFL